MIASLSGILANKGIDIAVVDVGGVGYEVHMPMRAIESLPAVGELVALVIHTNVREDAIQLFGFVDADDRRMFRLLTAVSGIGPKLALQALGTYSAAELRSFIMTSDERALSKIPGVGKKTAQRTILELVDKVSAMALTAGTATAALGASRGALDDLMLALIGLGYKQAQTDKVIGALRPSADSGASTESLLKDALALLRS